MVNVLLIDNYDSFTWNLVQILRESEGCRYEVVKNDEITPEECEPCSHLLLSPGPGLPWEAGATCEVIKRWSGLKPILGVCLGHQAIATVFGARLIPMSKPVHGQQSEIYFTQGASVLFKGIRSPVLAGRYHSWVVESGSVPEVLVTVAVDATGNIMALQHRNHPTFGVQFHPESIMTPSGNKIMTNWLNLV